MSMVTEYGPPGTVLKTVVEQVGQEKAPGPPTNMWSEMFRCLQPPQVDILIFTHSLRTTCIDNGFRTHGCNSRCWFRSACSVGSECNSKGIAGTNKCMLYILSGCSIGSTAVRITEIPHCRQVTFGLVGGNAGWIVADPLKSIGVPRQDKVGVASIAGINSVVQLQNVWIQHIHSSLQYIE